MNVHQVRWLLVSAACALVGCASDVSQSTSYRASIGRETHLLKPQVLWKHQDHSGELAPFELAPGYGTYSTNQRVGEVDGSVTLRIEKVMRRHYLIHEVRQPDEDFLIVLLPDPSGTGEVRATVSPTLVAPVWLD